MLFSQNYGTIYTERKGERKIETTRQQYERLTHTLRRIKHNCFYSADYWKKHDKEISQHFLELATNIVVFLDKVENIKYYNTLLTTSRIKQLQSQSKKALDVLSQTYSNYCHIMAELRLSQAELLTLIKQQRSTLICI